MKAVVLLSGGQDSTTCLYWALDKFTEVEAVCVNYGQRHSMEVDAAIAIAAAAGVPLDVIHVPGVLGGSSPLVSATPLETYDAPKDMPTGVDPTFVPARNILLLSVAANHAAKIDARHLVTGVCEADGTGYPDCRQVFIDSMGPTIGLGLYGDPDHFTIHTPLMTLTKAETVKLATEFDGCMAALAITRTCYSSSPEPCGVCHACIVRRTGFEDAGIPDPLFTKQASE
tara:strand:- start:12011 stop:12694 length:684 start_codon:yes stop_codon:yes gene_type:complete